MILAQIIIKLSIKGTDKKEKGTIKTRFKDKKRVLTAPASDHVCALFVFSVSRKITVKKRVSNIDKKQLTVETTKVQEKEKNWRV